MFTENRGEPLLCQVGDIILEHPKYDNTMKHYWFIYKTEPIKYKYRFKIYEINKVYCWDMEEPDSVLNEMVFHEAMGNWTYRKITP